MLKKPSWSAIETTLLKQHCSITLATCTAGQVWNGQILDLHKILFEHCQFSQQACTNCMQTYLHCYNINLFLSINDQFLL